MAAPALLALRARLSVLLLNDLWSVVFGFARYRDSVRLAILTDLADIRDLRRRFIECLRVKSAADKIHRFWRNYLERVHGLRPCESCNRKYDYKLCEERENMPSPTVIPWTRSRLGWGYFMGICCPTCCRELCSQCTDENFLVADDNNGLVCEPDEKIFVCDDCFAQHADSDSDSDTHAATNTIAQLPIDMVSYVAGFLDYFSFESLRHTCRAVRLVVPLRPLFDRTATQFQRVLRRFLFRQYLALHHLHPKWCTDCRHLVDITHSGSYQSIACAINDHCQECGRLFCVNCDEMVHHNSSVLMYCTECLEYCSSCSTDCPCKELLDSDSDSDTSSDTTVDIPVRCSDPEVIDL